MKPGLTTISPNYLLGSMTTTKSNKKYVNVKQTFKFTTIKSTVVYDQIHTH